MSTPYDRSDDKNRSWSDEQKKAIDKWTKEKWRDPKTCPICGVNDWHVSASPAYVPSGSTDGVVFLGDHFPFFAVICGNCGYTFFVNVVITDIGFPTKESENG